MYSDIGRSGVRGVALIVSGVRRSGLLDEQDAATGLSPFRRHTHTTPGAGIADYLEQRSSYGSGRNKFRAGAGLEKRAAQDVASPAL